MLLNPFYYYLTFTYNKEKEPFLTFVHKGNAVFLEKQWKDLRAVSASALRSSKIDKTNQWHDLPSDHDTEGGHE